MPFSSNTSDSFVDWDIDYNNLSHNYTNDFPKEPSNLSMKASSHILESIIRKHFPDLDKVKFIEVGCGGARNSIDLSLKGIDVTAVDFSSNAIVLAKKNASLSGAHLNIFQEDMYSRHTNELYNVILTTGLLEHFEDIDKPIEALSSYGSKNCLHIHIIIPKKFSSYTIANTLYYIPRFLKRCLSLNFDNIFTKSFRDFPHYENNYTKEFYSQSFSRFGIKEEAILASGSLYPFLALPKPFGNLLIKFFGSYMYKLMLYTGTRTSYFWHLFSPVFIYVGKAS